MLLQTKGLILALLLITALGYGLYGQIKINGELSIQNEILELEITELNNHINREIKRNLELQMASREINDEYIEATKEVTKYRNRQDVVFKKPGLVEIKLNKNYKSFALEFTEVSQ